jgi:hypothetical protein
MKNRRSIEEKERKNEKIVKNILDEIQWKIFLHGNFFHGKWRKIECSIFTLAAIRVSKCENKFQLTSMGDFNVFNHIPLSNFHIFQTPFSSSSSSIELQL